MTDCPITKFRGIRFTQYDGTCFFQALNNNIISVRNKIFVQ